MDYKFPIDGFVSDFSGANARQKLVASGILG